MELKPRAAAEARAVGELQRLGLHGADGLPILQHRSIWRLELPRRRVLAGAALAFGLTLGLFALRDVLARAWGEVLVGWLQALALPGNFDPVPRGSDESWFGIAVPLVDLRPRSQHRLAPLAHAAAVAAAWWLGGRLPDAARPAAYLLRFAALIHGAALGFFMLRGASFPHSLLGHTDEGLRQAWTLMLITPAIHFVTYYLFPFALRQHAALTLLTLLWLAVLTPLQYALHAALLQRFGLVVMPLLQLLFGVMVPIVGFVALYGWAMSWPDRTASTRPPPATPMASPSP